MRWWRADGQEAAPEETRGDTDNDGEGADDPDAGTPSPRSKRPGSSES